MKSRHYRIIGQSPLIMHNCRTADPLDAFARQMKEITSKRDRTDADLEQLAKLEFLAGLYVENGRPVIPGVVIEAALVQAARKSRNGQQARAGLFCQGNFLLEYEGPTEPEQLWADPSFRLVAGVRVGQSRIMRTRPRFDDWAAEVEVRYQPDLLNPAGIDRFMEVAGSVIGIGDWRPRFGRFETMVI